VIALSPNCRSFAAPLFFASFAHPTALQLLLAFDGVIHCNRLALAASIRKMDFADKTASPQQVHSPEAAASRQRQLSQPQAWQQQLRAPWEGSYTPVTHDGITFDVLSYLGVREWLFIALTSQRWRQLYAAVVTAENAACGEPGAPVAFTSRAAAFESAARLQIAVAAGLPLASTGTAASFRDLSREHYLAGRYGSCDALALAHKLGLPWTEQVCVSTIPQSTNHSCNHCCCASTLCIDTVQAAHAQD
jgi:hypothetical protein